MSARDADERIRDGEALAWRGEAMNKPDGLSVLEALVESIEAIEVQDDPRELKRRRLGVLAGIYKDRGRMLLGGRAFVHEESAAAGLMIRLANALSKSEAQRLERQMRKVQAAELQSTLRLVEGQEEGILLKSLIDWDECPDIVRPDGWICTPRELAKLKVTETGSQKLLVGLPMIMTRRYKDVDSGDWSVELAWREGKEWHRECIDRDSCFDTRALVRLARRGAPVSSVNGRLMIEWLQLLDQDPAMPTETSTVRMGWAGSRAHYYVLGQDTIRPSEDTHKREFRLIAPTSGGRQLSEAVSQRGTWDGWLDTLELIDNYPSPWAVLYAAATAPLLKILDAPNFAVDLEGPSGSGKSTSLELAASTYGEPRLGNGYRAWGGTLAGTEGAAGMMCDLPLCLDEGQKVPGRQREAAAALLHTIIDGAGRPKGALGRLGMGTVERWRTVLVSTSETGISSWADYDGAKARVVELRGRPLGRGQADRAEAIQAQVREHYGHLYPRLIQRLADMDRGQRAELRGLYRDEIRRLGSDEGVEAMARRAARYVAAVSVAAHVLHDELGIARPACDPLAWLWERVQECMGGGDKARGAISAAWAWIWAQRDRFQRSAVKAPPGGWLGIWDDGKAVVGVRRPELERALSEAGYRDHGAILREWADRGWIQTERGGLTMRVRDPHGARPWMIAMDLVKAEDEGL